VLLDRTPGYGGRVREDGGVTDRLRVLTLNVLTLEDAGGRERHAALRRRVPALGADVVAL
jgi:hypothetical protein